MKTIKKTTIIVILTFVIFLTGCEDKDDQKTVYLNDTTTTTEFNCVLPAVLSEADQSIEEVTFKLKGDDNNEYFHEAEAWILNADGNKCYVDAYKIRNGEIIFSFEFFADCLSDGFFSKDLNLIVKLTSLNQINWNINTNDLVLSNISYFDREGNGIIYSNSTLKEFNDLYGSFTFKLPYKYGEDIFSLEGINLLVEPNRNYYVRISNTWINDIPSIINSIDANNIPDNQLENLLESLYIDGSSMSAIFSSDENGIIFTETHIDIITEKIYIQIMDIGTDKFVTDFRISGSKIKENSLEQFLVNPW